MNIFKRFLIAIRLAFGEAMGFVKKNFDVAVLITEQAKKYLHSDEVRLVVTAVSGVKGVIALEIVQEVVDKAAFKFGIAQGIIKASEYNSDIAQGVLDYIKKERPELEENFYIVFTGELNVALSEKSPGGKILTLGEGITLGQLAWKEFQKQRNK